MQHCTRVLPAARMQHPTCCSPLPVLCTRYVLASKPDEYVFIYYLGNNDAWKGYGGATVYTRCERGARQEAARAGRRAGRALALPLPSLADPPPPPPLPPPFFLPTLPLHPGREASLPEEYIPELQAAAEAAGLNWADFALTDNTCPPHPPERT